MNRALTFSGFRFINEASIGPGGELIDFDPRLSDEEKEEWKQRTMGGYKDKQDAILKEYKRYFSENGASNIRNSNWNNLRVNISFNYRDYLYILSLDYMQDESSILRMEMNKDDEPENVSVIFSGDTNGVIDLFSEKGPTLHFLEFLDEL